MIEMRPVLDLHSIPAPYGEYISDHFRMWSDYSSNGSYHTLDLQEYRAYAVDNIDEYVEEYGRNKAMFMEWLEKQTSADEVILLYWW